MPKLLTDLPADVVQHILVRLTLAHHIARTAPTCHVVSVAARNAIKVRKFSGKIVTLTGHTELVCAATALDSRILIGAHSSIKVWRDGACERAVHAHHGQVRAVAVLPGGARFVSGSSDRTAKLWTLDCTLERTFEVDSRVFCVAALPDGVHFVVGLAPHEGNVRLYHVDGTLVHTFKGHTDLVWSLAVTPDGQHIISGSDDKTVKVWSVASKSLVSTCRGHTDGVEAVAAMPDGQRLLSGAIDTTVRVWLLDGTLVNTFRLHTARGHLPLPSRDVTTGYAMVLVALPDNQHALSGSDDRTVKLFNVNDGAVLRTFLHHNDIVTSLALMPDGLRFVSVSFDHTARIREHGLAPQA